MSDRSRAWRTFAFVDLAGFTALTEAHGDEEAATLAARFEELAKQTLGTGEELVKSIGDAVMLTAPEPGAGIDLVGRLCAATDAEESFPVVRAGLHHGPAVARGDDWFGAAVNLAARVTAQAAGGEVLATAAVARAATAAGAEVEPLGELRLRHVVGLVELFRLTPCPHPPQRVVDPVCHMAVDRARAAGRLVHGGRDLWFCSLSCAHAFAGAPDDYCLEEQR